MKCFTGSTLLGSRAGNCRKQASMRAALQSLIQFSRKKPRPHVAARRSIGHHDRHGNGSILHRGSRLHRHAHDGDLHNCVRHNTHRDTRHSRQQRHHSDHDEQRHHQSQQWWQHRRSGRYIGLYHLQLRIRHQRQLEYGRVRAKRWHDRLSIGIRH